MILRPDNSCSTAEILRQFVVVVGFVCLRIFDDDNDNDNDNDNDRKPSPNIWTAALETVRQVLARRVPDREVRAFGSRARIFPVDVAASGDGATPRPKR